MSQAQKGNWFLTSIIQRERLNDPLSDKETYHIVLDLKESGISYNVGDCLKIIPENCSTEVERILRVLGFGGGERTYDKEGTPYTIEQFLTAKADLHKITKKLFTTIVHNSLQESKESLLLPENKEALKAHLDETNVITELEKYRPTITAEELGTLLLPLMPRYYSLASSMRAVNQEAHLTVASVGVASDFLCKGVELFNKKIRIEHHKSPHFGLPVDSHQKPIIMIGPGTGIAPFRGFLQERLSAKASSANWLFFGERHAARDFYYRDYLKGLEEQGFLKLDTAFSRDSEQKVYVQHRMYEKRKELWQWIDHEGGYLFVCGDKNRMAKDVEETLLRIISEEGALSPPEAKAYLQKLKESKRYLRDVY